MARLLVEALEAGGHDVAIVSALRSFAAEPDGPHDAAIAAEAEVARLEGCWTVPGHALPDLWFTYHPFYKAPDWLGPALTQRFNLPYVTAEASHAGKRCTGPWAAWHACNEAALRASDLNFCFTLRDRDGLAEIVDSDRLMMLPPFIVTAPGEAQRPRRAAGPVELVTVAMMRPGDKSRSYAFLAHALMRLPAGLGWRLTIVGDGPARAEVAATFAGLPAERVVWRGQLPAAAVADALAAADLYVWPGFGEAYGLAYLEAGAAGLPALAQDCGGIASVVRDGITGCLVPEGAIEAFVAMLVRLIEDADLRRRLGRNAARMVRQERSLPAAAAILKLGIERALARRRA